MILVLTAAALFLAYANGANDNFKATATMYGSGTLGFRAALRFATVAQIAGSLASVLLAATLLKAFSGKGLVPAHVVADPAFLASVGLGAAATVLMATRLGIPISTTHALIGGLVGAGFVLASGDLSVQALGAKYFVPLLVSPMLALLGAACIYPIARSGRQWLGIEANTRISLGDGYDAVQTRADGTLALARTGMTLSDRQRANCEQTYDGSVAGVSAQKVVDALHMASAFSLGFARGLNDTPKVLALVAGAGGAGIEPRVSLGIVAIAMAAGGILHSRRIAETLGHRITSMNRGQGLIANTVASTLVIGASLMGSPVSTTHVSTGAIFGIGVWSGDADWRIAGGIAMAWVATLPMAALCAGIISTLAS